MSIVQKTGGLSGFVSRLGRQTPRTDDEPPRVAVEPRTVAAVSAETVYACKTLARFLDLLSSSSRRTTLFTFTLDEEALVSRSMQLDEVPRAEFLGRMRAAFEALEQAVADARIATYGTATWNGYRQPPSAPDFLSLPEFHRLASEVAGDAHHFRVVQLPYNLAMTEAFTHANQPMGEETVSLLEAARRLDIYVMTSASIYQGQLTRNLPPVIHEFLPGLRTDAQRALQFVRSTPGVGTALVGMKQTAHVEENAELGSVPPLPWEEFRKLFSEA